MRRSLLVLLVGLVGVVFAWLLAMGFGDDPLTAFELVATAAGTSLALSGLGIALIALLRRRRLVALLWIGVSFTVVGIGAGVAIAGDVMFLSPMDARAVIVMLVAAGTVGIGAALLLGAKMADAIGSVAAKANAILHPAANDSVLVAPPTRELEALAVHLDEVITEMRHAHDRERALEDSRRELIAWISHDLRTPLGGIRAMTEAIQDGVVDDTATIARYHATILSEVARLTSMVDDLFRLSQLHAGLVRLELEPVRLADLVSDALSLATPIAQARGVMLTGEVAELDRLVGLSTTEFLRVMRNLLDNAIRHTPEGGRVLVAADTHGDEAVVAVRDGCGGIPSDELERVFELGFRGDVARTPVGGPRAGLGLAIAKGLVDAHGGTIDVENRSGGCCFTVHLPFAASTTHPSS